MGTQQEGKQKRKTGKTYLVSGKEKTVITADADSRKHFDVIVIGAGAAGLAAAIGAGRSGAKVLVLEQRPEPCKKLYATGNGRCNFANLSIRPEDYRGSGAGLALQLT